MSPVSSASPLESVRELFAESRRRRQPSALLRHSPAQRQPLQRPRLSLAPASPILGHTKSDLPGFALLIVISISAHMSHPFLVHGTRNARIVTQGQSSSHRLNTFGLAQFLEHALVTLRDPPLNRFPTAQLLIARDPLTTKRFLRRLYGVKGLLLRARNVVGGRSSVLVQHQGQKASTNASPSSSPAQLANGYGSVPSKAGHQSAQYSSSQWQPSSRHPMYVAESSIHYQQHPDWQANTSAPMVQPSQYYGTASFDQSSYPTNNSTAISAMPRPGYGQPGVVPSQAYLGSSYSQLMGHSLSYSYDLDPSHVVSAQSSSYPEYYQATGDVFDTRASGMVSEHTEKAWADSVSPYASFQGHYV
ncbi:hypothetical protein EIP91_003252 [Steccherinum ochraceum]|uniref:Uncharacterized protein n=1 Tax=Steccherinum ochraceum TaxID=92696 RepID=A0A4R0RP87_9APHY|nr:hypothetical protein EIP91_003252 [Steccherinum ochraceum]